MTVLRLTVLQEKKKSPDCNKIGHTWKYVYIASFFKYTDDLTPEL